MNSRKVVLYIATSLDGYIAKTNNDLSFLAIVENPGEDYGYNDFINSVDTIIMGRKTYDWIVSAVAEFPHKDQETYVITHTPKPDSEKIKFYTGNLNELIVNLKSREGKNIFVDGGAEVVNELLRHNLIDELIISIIPVMLGEGIRLFQDGRAEQRLQLVESTTFESGLVQLHYQVASK